MNHPCLLSVIFLSIEATETLFIGTLLKYTQQIIPATNSQGTYQNAPFCTHMSFLMIFLTVKSVTTPASFFLTSVFIPFVASVSAIKTSWTAPASFFITVKASASFPSTTTSLTTPASLVILTSKTGVAFVNNCGPPNAPSKEKPIIHGVTNCTKLTPKFPIPACSPMAVPCSLLGKNRLVDGMYDEKSPPPNPQRNDIIRNVINGVSGFCTAAQSQTIGIIFIKVAIVITVLVPSIGIRNACTTLILPPERPGIAASQNSCIVPNPLSGVKPMFGRRTTTALMTNHVANEAMSPNVVTASVPHARPLPSDFQNCGSSGSHLFNHDILSHSFSS